MKIEIKGKDQHQINYVSLQNIADGVNKITINTLDKWLGLHNNGPRCFEENTNNNLYIVSPYGDGDAPERDIQICFIPENEEEQEIVKSLIYTFEDKDHVSFILIQRNKMLSIYKKENTKVLYSQKKETK